MSSCLPCLQACSVPLCTDEIIIGTIADVNTDIYILVHNKTTGRKQYISSQSDGAGVVTLVTDGLGLMAGHSYEISVIPRPGSPCDKKTIEIGTSSGTCISLILEDAKDSDGCPVTFTSVELEISEETEDTENCPCSTEKKKITSADFTGSDYTDADLVGLDETTDFIVFTNEGSGTLVDLTDGFNSFDPATGTLTMPAGKYIILIF